MQSPHARLLVLTIALSACAGGAASETDAGVFGPGDLDAATLGTDAVTDRPDALRPAGDATDGAGGQGVEADAQAPGTADAAVERPPEVCRRMRVVNTAAEGLNVRPDPSTAQAALTIWFDGTEAEVLAEVQGQDVDGNTLWYEVEREGVHGFVSTIWAECIERGAPPAPPPAPGLRDDVFLLPFACGQTRVVTQGNASGRGHDAAAAHAFDFDLPLGAPLRAMKPGQVLFTRDTTRAGDPCWSGAGRPARTRPTSWSWGTRTARARATPTWAGCWSRWGSRWRRATPWARSAARAGAPDPTPTWHGPKRATSRTATVFRWCSRTCRAMESRTRASA